MHNEFTYYKPKRFMTTDPWLIPCNDTSVFATRELFVPSLASLESMVHAPQKARVKSSERPCRAEPEDHFSFIMGASERV